MTEDRTFHAESRYGSMLWCATALGMTLAEFRRQRPVLEAHSGFPLEDPILCATIKSDVDDWIARRKKIYPTHPTDLKPSSGEANYALF